MPQNLFKKRIGKKNLQKGFTLIEMIISLGIFTIVALIAVGALLKTMDSNRKALTLKTAINNLNFALESMSREMRVGNSYVMTTPNGGWEIQFTFPKGLTTCDIHYRYINQTLEKAQLCGGGTATDFQPVISPDITIVSSILTMPAVTGARPPWAHFSFVGYTGIKEKDKTEFSMQTRVSQRIK